MSTSETDGAPAPSVWHGANGAPNPGEKFTAMCGGEFTAGTAEETAALEYGCKACLSESIDAMNHARDMLAAVSEASVAGFAAWRAVDEALSTHGPMRHAYFGDERSCGCGGNHDVHPETEEATDEPG